MVRRLGFALTLAALATTMTTRSALAIEERIWLSAGPSALFYDPEQSLRDNVGVGIRAGGFLNRWIGIEGVFSTASPTAEVSLTGATFTHFGGGLILTPDRHRWSLPYLSAGLGSVRTEDATGETKSYGAYHLGGGITIRLGERLGFQLDGRNLSYEQEGGTGRDTRVNTFQVTGSVSAFWMGRPRDTDEDGVPDKGDKSPATPAGAVVDASGAPLDTDRDGVFDGLDKSPSTPLGARVGPDGTALDADQDGVADGIDQCDSTAAGVLVDAKGCGLDTDQDHVFDGPDRCPDTPAGAVVDVNGCPLDADGDGIADGVDICPHTPAGVAVNAGGCPIELSAYEREMTEEWLIRLTDLEFAPDSAALLPQAIQRLDGVAAVLAQWPSIRFEIGAHVDDVPEPGYRIPLSQMRVRAVLQHVLAKAPGLDPKNFWITGYGDTDPLFPNTSSARRTLNRRVEFRVLNPNVLVQEKLKRESFGSAPAVPSPGLEPKTPAAPPGG